MSTSLAQLLEELRNPYRKLARELDRELIRLVESVPDAPTRALKALLLLVLRYGDVAEAAKTGSLDLLLKAVENRLRELKVSDSSIARFTETVRKIAEEIRREGAALGRPAFRIAVTYVEGSPVLGVELYFEKLPEVLRRLLQEALLYRFHVASRNKLEETYRLIGRVEEDRAFVPLYISDELLALLEALGVRRAGIAWANLADLIMRYRKIELPERIEAPRLREYQEEAIRAWLENGGRGIIVLPTGAGKTLIGIEIIRRLKLPTLIIVPYRAIVKRWRDEILKRLGIQVVTTLRAPTAIKGIAPVVILTERGLYEVLKRAAEGHRTERRIVELLHFIASRGLVIFDEVHHIGAPGYLCVLLSLNPRYVLGLTATPERLDKNEYPVYVFLGGIVYAKTYAELAMQHFLAPILVDSVELGLWTSYRELAQWLYDLARKLDSEGKPALAAFARKLADLAIKAIEGGQVVITKGRRKIVKKIPPLEDLIAAMASAARRGDWKRYDKLFRRIDHWRLEFLRALAAARRAYEEYLKGRKVIVFCRFRRTARLIHDILEKLLGVNTALITKDVKEIDDVYLGRARVVVATAAGEEGVDLPDLDTVIFSHVPESPRVIIQRVGRVCRYRPGKVARVVLVYFRNFRPDRRRAETAMAILEREYPQELMRALARHEERVIEEAERELEVLRRARRFKTERAWEIVLSRLRPYLPWIDQWFSLVLKKRPQELTKLDRALLLLLRMLVDMEILGSTQAIGTDIRFAGRRIARTVMQWMSDPRRYELPGVDTPDMLPLYRKLKKLLRKGRLDKAVDAVLEWAGREEVERLITKILRVAV